MTTTASPAELLSDVGSAARSGALWRDTIANVLRQRNARIGIAILGFLLICAVFADEIGRAHV